MNTLWRASPVRLVPAPGGVTPRAVRSYLAGMTRKMRDPIRHATLPVTGYCTPAQAAEILSVSVHTLEKWRRPGYEGIGPRYRLHGRHVRYDPRDLLEWSETRGRN